MPRRSAPLSHAVRLIALAAVAVLSCAACGSSHHGPAPLGAAEPAVAPTGGPAPAGVVRAVGAAPEGIVYDARTGLIAVAVRAPDRLVLLNGATLAVVRTVALPGHARHLQLARAGGPVLVPDESSNSLIQVALPGGATTRIPVGASPHDAAETTDGYIVVGNEFGKSISIIRQGAVQRTVADLTQPGGVVADGTRVAVVDVGAFTVSTYDPASGALLTRLPAGAGPTHGIAAGPTSMVVADTRGDALLTFGLDPLRRLSSVPLPGSPYGLAFDPVRNWVWVTLTARNQVVALSLASGTPTVVARFATVAQPDTVAVAPGSHTIWVTGTRAGVVERITR